MTNEFERVCSRVSAAQRGEEARRTDGRFGLTRRAYVVLLLLSAFSVAGRAADDAEYALRWNPAAGGPATLEEVLGALKLPGAKAKESVVQYFAIDQPDGLAQGFRAIARERRTSGEVDATYKLRGPNPIPVNGPMASWRCPLMLDAETKREVDVSVIGERQLKKSYSVSCTAQDSLAAALAASFHAVPLGCKSNVARIKASKVKVERWELPGGKVAFEVSRNGKDRPADLEEFLSQVVRPLLVVGAKPLADSKTELGSAC